MKLNYLQFLELEVFTRFGARLEASMETTIKRGRVLRELLKQDRFMPVLVTAQLAWLMAFNDGYFDNMEPDEAIKQFDILLQHTQHTYLILDSPREQWSELIARSLVSTAGENQQ